MTITDGRAHRRTVLKAVAGTVGAVGGAPIGVPVMRASAARAPPPVEWTQTYEEKENDFAAFGFIQTADGGYALHGAGPNKPDSEHFQFGLLKTDADGDRQWIAFATDGKQESEQISNDVVQTSNGAYVVVGSASVYNDEGDVSKGIAEAAKISPDGDVQWVTTLLPSSEYDGPGEYDFPDARFTGAAPAGTDGSVVVGGATTVHTETIPWLVKLAADGSVGWKQTYDRGHVIDQVLPRGNNGFLLFKSAADNYYAILVDETGTIERAVRLQGTYDGYLNVFIPTADGGYAYTAQWGSSGYEKSIGLTKFTGAGERQWRKKYPAPQNGEMVAYDLIQTEDGGYVLCGYVSPSPDRIIPTILKTDDRGEKQWQKRFTKQPPTRGGGKLLRTADGGSAVLFKPLDMTVLIKLAPSETKTDTATTNPDAVTPTQTSTEDQPNSSSPPGHPTQDDSPNPPTTAPETTSVNGPGFGVVAALSGCGLAAWRFLSDE